MKFNSSGYLDAGIHDTDLASIEEHFVRGFPTSNTRTQIAEGYKRHRGELESLNIPCEQLIDGSFVTTKNDPGDIDLVCFADADAVDALSPPEQQRFRSLFLGTGTKQTHLCDAYFCPTVPETDPRFKHTRPNRKYWMGEFGYDRLDKPKGILRVKIPESIAVTP